MSLKNFLEANKVYFETVAAVSLSLMAVLVSIVQSCTAAYQTKLLDRQTRAAEAQVVPQLNLRVEHLYDEATETYPDEALIIDNEGGFARNWKIETAEFIRVVCRGEPSPQVEMRTAKMPVTGYYTIGFLSSAQKGQLYKLEGAENNKKLSDLNDKLASSPQCAFAFADMERYVKVTYEDVLGNHYTQFFSVVPVEGMSELTEKQGDLIFQKWSDGVASGAVIEFSKITPELLLGRLTRGKRDGA